MKKEREKRNEKTEGEETKINPLNILRWKRREPYN